MSPTVGYNKGVPVVIAYMISHSRSSFLAFASLRVSSNECSQCGNVLRHGLKLSVDALRANQMLAMQHMHVLKATSIPAGLVLKVLEKPGDSGVGGTAHGTQTLDEAAIESDPAFDASQHFAQL